MVRKTLVFLLKMLLLIVLGFLFGLIAGAYIGGNFMTSFEFNGVRGYEATGQIGAFAGAVLSPVLGCYLTRKRRKKRVHH
jgi:membrane associated rhomboid family serine protease